MKHIKLFSLVCLFLVSCTPSTPVPAPTTTQTPNPTVAPTDWPLPDGTTFTFGDDVSINNQQIIKRGIVIASNYFQAHRYTAGSVKIYAYGNGDEVLAALRELFPNYTFQGKGIWTTGGGTAYRGLIMFATISPGFENQSENSKYVTVFHEYTHAVQSNLYGTDIFTGDKVPKTGPVWIIEGCAEYFANKIADLQDLDNFDTKLGIALNETATDPGLSNYESWGRIQEIKSTPYLIGFAACEFLSKQKGASALLDYWRLQGEGEDWHDAFKSAFGISIDDFYRKFETVRTTQPSFDTSVCAVQSDSQVKCLGLIYKDNLPVYVFELPFDITSQTFDWKVESNCKLTKLEKQGDSLAHDNQLLVSVDRSVHGACQVTVNFPDNKQVVVEFAVP